jgi:hypothetical protein
VADHELVMMSLSYSYTKPSREPVVK